MAIQRLRSEATPCQCVLLFTAFLFFAIAHALPAGTLSSPRFDFSVIYLNDSLILIGGRSAAGDSGTIFPSVEVFTLSQGRSSLHRSLQIYIFLFHLFYFILINLISIRWIDATIRYSSDISVGVPSSLLSCLRSWLSGTSFFPASSDFILFLFCFTLFLFYFIYY